MSAQGIAMAERLYRDAVQRGRIPEDARIPLASLGQELGEKNSALFTSGTTSDERHIRSITSSTDLMSLQRLQPEVLSFPGGNCSTRVPGELSIYLRTTVSEWRFHSKAMCRKCCASCAY